MMNGPAETAAILGALAALITAASAGMVKIIREIQAISNGKMALISEQLERLTKIEQVNLNISGKMFREIKELRADMRASSSPEETGQSARKRKRALGAKEKCSVK